MQQKKQASVLKRLLPYSGKKAYMLQVAMVLSALSGICMLMPMVFIHRIVKEIILHGVTDTSFIYQNAMFAFGFAIGGFVIYMGALIVSHIFAFEVEHNIVKLSMKKMMEMPLGFFSNRESGKLRKIIIDGAGQTHTFLAHQLPDFASTMISPLVLIIFFILFDWRIGIVGLIPIMLGMAFMATMMGKKGIALRNQYFDSMAQLSSQSVEYVRGIPVVKTFAQSLESFEQFHGLIQKVQAMVLKLTLQWKNKMSLFEALAPSSSFFIVPVAMLMISKGGNIQQVIANSIIYILIVPTFTIFIMRSAQIRQYMYFAELALNKIDEELSYPILMYGNQVEADASVTFKQVSFSYNQEKVLEDVSFTIQKGETVAIVGPSGGGKTTIARLACRFYDVDEGEVCIGDTNIKAFSKEALMKKIAFVFQNSRLFKMSLKENLLLGNPHASEQEITQALIDSGSMEIVERLKDGLDTVYGSKGTYFSGGEVQRLSIARALLKNADIIILDEATAFADPENEKVIQASFKKLAKDKTTLMIAHRLSTIVEADKILVVDAGRIVECGSHEELLAFNGVYKELWKEYQKAATWSVGGQYA